MDDLISITYEGAIKIQRKITNANGIVEYKTVQVGNYYFKGDMNFKQYTSQISIQENITDELEKKQIATIYKDLYMDFIDKTQTYGWGQVIDVTK